jgi:hypothetical protein
VSRSTWSSELYHLTLLVNQFFHVTSIFLPDKLTFSIAVMVSVQAASTESPLFENYLFCVGMLYATEGFASIAASCSLFWDLK